MMRHCLVLLLLLFKLYPGQAQQFYTLEDCYRLALENNVALQREENTIHLGMIDRQSAQLNRLPSLAYSVNHYFSFGKNIDPVTNGFVYERFSGGATGLGMQLELFSGFRNLYAIKESAYNIQAASYSKKRTELELMSNITLVYSRLLFSKEQAAMVRNNIQTTRQELKTVQEKIRTGRLTKYEAYSFDARLNSELAELITAQNDSLAALQELRQLLNLPYKHQLQVMSIDTSLLAGIYTTSFIPEELMDQVLQRHPVIKQAQMNEQAIRYRIKAAKSTLAPSLMARGTMASNYNNNETVADGTPLAFQQQLNDNLGQNINLSLDIPIFSRRDYANRVKKEKVNLANAKLATREAENAVISNTVQLVNDFNAARQKYQATRAAWQQNKLSYSLYHEKHRLGQVSAVELFSARDMLNAATARYIQARLELYFRHQLLRLLQSS